MKNVKQILFLVLMMVLCAGVVAADEKGGQSATTGPTVISRAKFPLTVGSGEYDLITQILDFPAGAVVGKHMHGGHVLVTVLSGEITLREKGVEKIVKAGESWTEFPGNVHTAANEGTVIARIVAVYLVPKGAEATTMLK
jgi:quercetin dioxygenase-like cupin family protein